MTNPSSSIIALLALLAGACSFTAEADIPEADVTQRGVGMPGMPQAHLLGDVSVSGSFTFASANTAWAKHMNSEVSVRQVTVTAASGLPNLDFIKSAQLTMSDPTIAESTTEIANYQRSDATLSSSVIDISMPAPVDITTLWSAEKTVIGVQVTGQVPEQSWTVDVTMKLAGKITYNY